MTLTHPHVIIKDNTSDALTDGELAWCQAAGLLWQNTDGYWHLYADIHWVDIDKARSDYHEQQREAREAEEAKKLRRWTHPSRYPAVFDRHEF